MKKHLFILLFAIISVFCIHSIDIKEGRVKLTIHEAQGRFSLSYMTDIAKESYEPLFVSQDPRTSFFALLIDDRVYKLGDSSAFRSRVERYDNKVAQVFESPSIQVIQEFSFIKTKDAILADGININLKVINRGDKDISLGIRFLLDTNLGEKTSTPFYTNTRKITSETIIRKSDNESFWYGGDETFGIMGNINTPNTTTPDLLHFANWKRLNDATWAVDFIDGRNFNMLPYSIGDSAVCYYFNTMTLARGLEKSISLSLSKYNPAGFDLGVQDQNDFSRLLQTSSVPVNDPVLALRTDLITIRDLLLHLDLSISAGGQILDDELQTLETILAKLKERNMKY